MSASPLHSDRPPLQGVRRSFTMPTRQLSIHEKAGLEKADADADVLYTHPTARIISFSPPTDSIKSSSKTDIPADTDYPIDTVETLPWRSRTETLSASGTMIIEKVRGSTNFLKCQDIMHAILRNSQCWCVDGESKFVLRVRKFQYYRIELPSTTGEDKAKVEELKKVFPTVLRFERTPCPFIRAFSVDLPDDAITPRRKGPWKRRDSSQPNISDTESPSDRKSKPTRSWSMRSPPTSYPKSGPSYATPFERGRPGSSTGPSRRESLPEDYRNSSPASHTPSEDDADSEQQESEHSSEKGSTTDRSLTASPRQDVTKDESDILLEAASTSEAEPNTVLQSNETPRISRNISRVIHKENEATEPENTVGNMAIVDHAQEGDPMSYGKAQKTTTQETIPLVASMEAKKAAIVHEQSTDDDDGDDDEGEEEDDEDEEEEKEDQGESDETSSEELQSDEAAPESIPVSVAVDQTAAQGSKTSFERAGSVPNAYAAASEQSGEGIGTSSEPQNFDSADSEDSEESEEPDTSDESEHSEDSKERSTAKEVVEAPADVQPGVAVPSFQSSQDISPHLHTSDEDSDEQSADMDEIEGRDTPLASSIGEDQISTPLSPAVPAVREIEEEDYNDDSLSTVSSVDSFHTMISTVNASSISDDAARTQIPDPIRRPVVSQNSVNHKREVSELTVTASNISGSGTAEQGSTRHRKKDYSQAPLTSQSSALNSPGPESATPSPSAQDSEGLRQRLRTRRSFSPLPPPSTIFTGNQIKHDSSGHMTKAILQKVIVKPIEAVVLMVHILARIAGGATMSDLLSGDLFRRPEHARSISGFADQLNSRGEYDSDAEDDFGIPIRGRQRSSETRAAVALDDAVGAGSEDID